MMSKMVPGLPSIYSNKGVCEGCVLGKHHKEMFDKGKAWCVREPLQLIHSDICGPLEFPSISHATYFITFIDDFSRKSWVYFLKHKSETFLNFNFLNPWLKMNLVKKIRL